MASLVCLLLLLPLARKEVHGGPEEFIVKLGYRWTGSGKGSDFTVEDELPNTLDVVRGELVRKLPWQELEYTIDASEELVFTLQNRSFDITLPAARFSYKPDGAETRETVETAPVSFTMWHPSVQGTWNVPWLVFLVVWVLPIAAAVISIGSLSAPASVTASMAASGKPKKN